MKSFLSQTSDNPCQLCILNSIQLSSLLFISVTTLCHHLPGALAYSHNLSSHTSHTGLLLVQAILKQQLSARDVFALHGKFGSV